MQLIIFQKADLWRPVLGRDPMMVNSCQGPPPHTVSNHSSSETQGQIVGVRESLNGRKNVTRRKVKNGKKSPWGQCLIRPVPNGHCHSDFWLAPENFNNIIIIIIIIIITLIIYNTEHYYYYIITVSVNKPLENYYIHVLLWFNVIFGSNVMCLCLGMVYDKMFEKII